MRLRVAHVSMQTQDSPAQQSQDSSRVFRRARGMGYGWLTGTEAWGTAGLAGMLREDARANGYRFWTHPSQDSWIAVQRGLVDGGWSTHYEKVVDGVKGHFTDKGVLAVGFDNDLLGRVNVIACHYNTRGREKGHPQYVNNLRLARAIGGYTRKVGQGTDLVFYGGDQNMLDSKGDTFLGEPLTSVADEVGKWPKTHRNGPIDVLASYDRDTRVQALSTRVLDDTEFPLHTDHYLIEAVFEIAPLRRKAKA